MATSDCDSVLCDVTAKKCSPPTHTDGIQNGDETGVDCGGPCGACSGPGAGVGSTLQVENQTYDADNGTNCGVQVGICHENNNTTVGSVDSGDWVKFSGVDLTGVKGMHMQLAARAISDNR